MIVGVVSGLFYRELTKWYDFTGDSQLGRRATFMIVEADRVGMRQIAALVETGRLRPHLDRVLPLDLAVEAHELIALDHRSPRVRWEACATNLRTRGSCSITRSWGTGQNSSI